MTEPKNLGSKLLGLFVETDGEKPAEEKSPADIVNELAAESVGKPSAAGTEPVPGLKLDRVPSGPAPSTHFEAIFRDAGMDANELDRVKKAEELLKSLPESTPQTVKKQIVEASLKAFGFEVEKIVLAAQNQKRALDAYVKVNETATAKAIQDAEAQIRTLTEKIANLRADIEKRTGGLSQLASAAQTRKADVQKVIDFFQAPPSGA
jgi:hypothetical protein